MKKSDLVQHIYKYKGQEALLQEYKTIMKTEPYLTEHVFIKITSILRKATERSYNEVVLQIVKYLSSIEYNIDEEVLFMYCTKGDFTMVQALFGMDISYSDYNYNLAFWNACESGNLDLVIYLYYKRTHVIEKDDESIVKLFNKGVKNWSIINFFLFIEMITREDIISMKAKSSLSSGDKRWVSLVFNF